LNNDLFDALHKSGYHMAAVPPLPGFTSGIGALRKFDAVLASPGTTLLTDAVEKVRGLPSLRNNRIRRACLANQCCPNGADLESILLGEVPKIFFRQHRPGAALSRAENPALQRAPVVANPLCYSAILAREQSMQFSWVRIPARRSRDAAG
jgi:hypothetical protein